MFLILSRMTTGVPRLTVAAAGTGVTEISVSAHVVLALTLVSVPAGCGVTGADDGPPPSVGWFGSMSPGAGKDGPPPGFASVNDGSSAGVLTAVVGNGPGEDALLPCWFLPSS